MRNAILYLLIGIYLGCTGFTVVGHRGDPSAAPEETLEADDAAFAAGADLVELDVQESEDGVLVVQHDATIQRMTGAPLAIATTPFATLHAYHTKNGEPVHSLDEVLSHYQHRAGRLLIETKIEKGVPHPHLEQKIAAALARHHMTDRVMFHSFSKPSLKRLQKVLPRVPRLLIVGSLHRITFAVFKYATGIDVSVDLVTPEMVKSLHAMNQQVFVWDEMTETTAKWRWLANLNIDGVVTNYPAVAHRYADLRHDASHRALSARLVNTTDRPLPVYENPYLLAATSTTLAPGASCTATAAVESGGRWYARIGQNRFVPMAALTKAPQAGWAQALVGRHLTVAPTGQRLTPAPAGLRLALHPAARVASGRSGSVVAGAVVRVRAVALRRGQVWCRVTTVVDSAPRADATGWVRLHKLAAPLGTAPQPLNRAALPEAPRPLWHVGALSLLRPAALAE
ncbi:glycerophosphodiester phosphodiesterase [Lacticaseibacillus kribbianus]|uniref:glycerophosphodiester phosphodiesterase n=1 Tax=Lacticaseibacillus kribbianus TaxID=2926292 RepID=UPI001CD6A9D5|nr:glycerophosphodiester phosphodiesterase [Lacticaseibacillus kribbianus]